MWMVLTPKGHDRGVNHINDRQSNCDVQSLPAADQCRECFVSYMHVLPPH